MALARALSMIPIDTPRQSCIIGPKVDKPDNDTTPTQSPDVLTATQVSGEGVMRDEEE